MPKNATQSIPARSMTRVTDTAVTALRVQNQGLYPILVCATVGTVAPADTQGALELRPGEALLPDTALTSLWPGITAANHVWVWSEVAGSVSVSHG